MTDLATRLRDLVATYEAAGRLSDEQVYELVEELVPEMVRVLEELTEAVHTETGCCAPCVLGRCDDCIAGSTDVCLCYDGEHDLGGVA